MIRVLIVDGQSEVRLGLQMRLAIEPDMVVVGETGGAEEALVLARTLAPDVIVVDTGMRGAGGVDVVKRLRAAAPAARIVVLTLRGDEETRARAYDAGAQAFLEKHGGAADLLQAIRRLPPRLLLGNGSTTASPLAIRRLGAV
jgi:DNA-binding NarL/FixJ family response regulator